MSDQLDPRYDHKTTEEKIYSLWESSGVFNPDNAVERQAAGKQEKKPFCVIMPPPNANGALHVGHAVGITLQDLMTRFSRMRGYAALWLPGADHAGFETQVVYDKKLEKEGRNRAELGRDELWKEIWNFTQKNKATMENQLRKLGASCDWSREKFTLDPDIVRTVYDTFAKLYEDGLIYRDLKVVNWCPKHRTALSDLEVKYVERADPLYYVSYGPLTLATVRPETKFGDTALAVNPKDKRYQKYIGKEIRAKGILGPLTFRVIADGAVDQKFGTGVIKITPAHDATDFEIWQRHKKEIDGPRQIIDETGRLFGPLVGRFAGQKVAEAREKVAETMREAGILEKVEPGYIHQVATCYKCGSTLEPLPKPQWFVKTAPLAKSAIAAVEQKKIVFHPDRSKKVFLHWMKNIRDWNISRQIVWGIRIPAWFCLGCGTPAVNAAVKSKWFLVRHGETDWNKEGRLQGQADTPMNDQGRAQVRATAEKLHDKDIALIVSSDLGRCRETSKIIAERTGAPVIFDTALRERFQGPMEGMYREEAQKKYGNLYPYEEEVAGAENYRELEERVWEAFRTHRAAHGHKNVVVVSHSGVMRVLVKRIKNLAPSEAMSRPTIPNTEVITLDVLEKPCKNCGGDLYEQDPDVFDTWFSSGQWPFATLMAPSVKRQASFTNKRSLGATKTDFERFYPTDVMETAYDILFFWVARMAMLGLYCTGKVPFRKVYLHGLVRDKDRQKMSKSKGNVLDPLGVAETYGTDALRMALVIGNAPGNDIVISEDKIRGYRNFATKLWNISRFVLLNRPSGAEANATLTAADRKHLAALANVKKRVTKYIEELKFHLAAETLYHYVWHTFADKIIEEYKPHLKAAIGETAASAEALGMPARFSPGGAAGAKGSGRALRGSAEAAADARKAYFVLESILLECLTMLHPFMPFITEAIYQKTLPPKARGVQGRPRELLMIRRWHDTIKS